MCVCAFVIDLLLFTVRLRYAEGKTIGSLFVYLHLVKL